MMETRVNSLLLIKYKGLFLSTLKFKEGLETRGTL